MKTLILHGLSGFTLLGGLVCFLPGAAASQAAIEITAMSGSSLAVDTFGISVLGSYCIDDCPDAWFYPVFCESVLSPVNPSMFDVRFVESRAGSTCLGAGVRVNIQQGEPIKPDTFWMGINQPDTNAYPISISWRTLDYPYGLIDGDISFKEIWLSDTGTGVMTPVDMLADSTTTIYDRRITVLQIISTTEITGDVDEPGYRPAEFKLLQSYPNPFNPGTTITYTLSAPEFAELSVYDGLGRRVSILDHGRRTMGVHSVHFDATDLPAGIYVARLVTTSTSESVKMLYVK